MTPCGSTIPVGFILNSHRISNPPGAAWSLHQLHPTGILGIPELTLTAQPQHLPRVGEEEVPAVPVVSGHFQAVLSLSLSFFTLDRISQPWVLFLLFFCPCHLQAVPGSRAGMGKAGICSLLGLDLSSHLTRGGKKRELILDEQELIREGFFNISLM